MSMVILEVAEEREQELFEMLEGGAGDESYYRST